MAAVLAGGPGAVLSHRAAAAHQGLRWDWHGRIDVTVPQWRRPRAAIAFHQALLPADETTTKDGIPVTTVARTIFDLAAVAPHREVERAMNEAEVRQLTGTLSLPDLIDRYPGRRGVRTIREILARGRLGTTVSKSELEERFLAFLDRRGFPRPELNVPLCIDGHFCEVDCLWRAERLVAELDGYATHSTPKAFDRDRSKLRSLSAAGFATAPVTAHHLDDEPDQLAGDLWRLLQRAGFARANGRLH